jgi:hypothetical protein
MILQAPTERIKRLQIDFAAYNPRRISEGNKKRLKKSLKEFGLVQDPIWNKRTGRLVGGHQRVEIMDSEARGKNFEIDVKVVDLDDKAEAKLNVLLNNTSAMGEFDFDAIKSLSESFEIDLGEMGFSAQDLAVDFGFDSGMDASAAQDIGEAKQKKLDARAKGQKAGQAGEVGATDAKYSDFAFQVVFESNESKSTFLGKLGFAGNSKAVKADLLMAAIRSKIELGTF